MVDVRALGLVAVLCMSACAADPPPRHVDAPVAPAPTPRRVGDVVPPRRAAPIPAVTSAPDRKQSIGLIASDDDAITAALARGARRALDEVRAAGGPDVALLVSEREARWSAAAEAAVRLALDEGALAIITPPERARAHAIAQLGTRAQIPIISTSPAPTVMQAGSKWVTSVVAPDDRALTEPPEGDWEQAGYDAARSAVLALPAR